MPWGSSSELRFPCQESIFPEAFPRVPTERYKELVMGTALFPSCDPTRFPLKAYRNASQGAANYRDSCESALIYPKILSGKQVPNFGGISTKFLVMCRSGMAAWRSNLSKLAWRREKSPFPMILVPDGHRNVYVKRDEEENEFVLHLKCSRSCARHTRHMCISTCHSGHTITL